MDPKLPKEARSTEIGFNPRFAMNMFLSHDNDPIFNDARWFAINHWAAHACLKAGVSCPSWFPGLSPLETNHKSLSWLHVPFSYSLIFFFFFMAKALESVLNILFFHWLDCNLASSGLISLKSPLASGHVQNEKFREGDQLSGIFAPSPQTAPMTAIVTPWYFPFWNPFWEHLHQVTRVAQGMMPVTTLGSASPCSGKSQTILLERRKQRGHVTGEGTTKRGGLKAGSTAYSKMSLSRFALGLSFP